MKTNFDLYSNIAMQYGLADSLAEIAIKAKKDEQFKEAMDLVDQMDPQTLDVLSIYIEVLLNQAKAKKAA